MDNITFYYKQKEEGNSRLFLKTIFPALTYLMRTLYVFAPSFTT